MLGMPVDAGVVPMPQVGLVTCVRAKHRFTQRQLAAMLCLTSNVDQSQVYSAAEPARLIPDISHTEHYPRHKAQCL